MRQKMEKNLGFTQNSLQMRTQGSLKKEDLIHFWKSYYSTIVNLFSTATNELSVWA